MWPKGIKNPGRTIRDFVSFIDFTPTFLELANIALDKTGMKQLTGKSLTSLFSSSKSGWIEPGRDYVLIGKERHDVGRPSNQGYPIRGIVTRDYLYIKNYETKRWPVGNPETGYLNCDGSPTKTVCIKTRNTVDSIYWRLNFGFRPSEELYDLKKDRDCMNNLATDKRHAAKKQKLIQLMVKELKLQNDPRMFGKGEMFDNYPVAPLSYMFYYENYLNNKAEKVNWVNPGDYE
jgi:arylsulfatase A-like enzyme